MIEECCRGRIALIWSFNLTCLAVAIVTVVLRLDVTPHAHFWMVLSVVCLYALCVVRFVQLLRVLNNYNHTTDVYRRLPNTTPDDVRAQVKRLGKIIHRINSSQRKAKSIVSASKPIRQMLAECVETYEKALHDAEESMMKLYKASVLLDVSGDTFSIDAARREADATIKAIDEIDSTLREQHR